MTEKRSFEQWKWLEMRLMLKAILALPMTKGATKSGIRIALGVMDILANVEET